MWLVCATQLEGMSKKKSVVFLNFTVSVRSRPPGPPAVPGVFLFHTLITNIDLNSSFGKQKKLTHDLTICMRTIYLSHWCQNQTQHVLQWQNFLFLINN